jgi:UDP-3-O-[3-hydroxymyristoyl] glucosamine N-acyltransferase
VALIVSAHPRSAFAACATRMFALRDFQPGDAAVHVGAHLAEGVVLAPGVVIGDGVAIGRGAMIGANSVIAPGVQIGAGCRIGANVSIRCALIGDGVTILSGARIGENGFGVSGGPHGLALTPHFGRVILQSGVSIGANSCVDRGFLDDTVVAEGTQIDNLSHIAHNVKVGARVVMAAFAGVSGSARIGDDVQLGGRAGIADHLDIGAGSRLAAGSAVLKDVPPGETHGGYPAKPIRTWMRELAWLARQAQKRG